MHQYIEGDLIGVAEQRKEKFLEMLRDWNEERKKKNKKRLAILHRLRARLNQQMDECEKVFVSTVLFLETMSKEYKEYATFEMPEVKLESGNAKNYTQVHNEYVRFVVDGICEANYKYAKYARALEDEVIRKILAHGEEDRNLKLSQIETVVTQFDEKLKQLAEKNAFKLEKIFYLYEHENEKQEQTNSEKILFGTFKKEKEKRCLYKKTLSFMRTVQEEEQNIVTLIQITFELIKLASEAEKAREQVLIKACNAALRLEHTIFQVTGDNNNVLENVSDLKTDNNESVTNVGKNFEVSEEILQDEQDELGNLEIMFAFLTLLAEKDAIFIREGLQKEELDNMNEVVRFLEHYKVPDFEDRVLILKEMEVLRIKEEQEDVPENSEQPTIKLEESLLLISADFVLYIYDLKGQNNQIKEIYRRFILKRMVVCEADGCELVLKKEREKSLIGLFENEENIEILFDSEEELEEFLRFITEFKSLKLNK